MDFDINPKPYFQQYFPNLVQQYFPFSIDGSKEKFQQEFIPSSIPR
jgi:hypothetical protein